MLRKHWGSNQSRSMVVRSVVGPIAGSWKAFSRSFVSIRERERCSCDAGKLRIVTQRHAEQGGSDDRGGQAEAQIPLSGKGDNG